jgi:hypothetical protein
MSKNTSVKKIDKSKAKFDHFVREDGEVPVDHKKTIRRP